MEPACGTNWSWGGSGTGRWGVGWFDSLCRQFVIIDCLLLCSLSIRYAVGDRSHVQVPAFVWQMPGKSQDDDNKKESPIFDQLLIFSARSPFQSRHRFGPLFSIGLFWSILETSPVWSLRNVITSLFYTTTHSEWVSEWVSDRFV